MSVSAPRRKALIADLLANGATEVRLPSEDEWRRIAGGEANDRYPWDQPQQEVTKTKETIAQRANIDESNIGRTSPVGMFPQGSSHPFGLMDLAGNVWEWTNSWYDDNKTGRVLRGGSWLYNQTIARVSGRDWDSPYDSYDSFGFRLVSPSFLDSGS